MATETQNTQNTNQNPNPAPANPANPVDPKNDPFYRGNGAEVVARPDDVTEEEASATSATQTAPAAPTPALAKAPAPQPLPAQSSQKPTLAEMLDEARLSECSVKFREHPLLVLHGMGGKDAAPVSIEEVLKTLWAISEENRPDPLSFPEYVFAVSPATGRIDHTVSNEIPDELRQAALKEHEDKIRDFLAKLNGDSDDRPELPEVPELAKALNSAPKDYFFSLARALSPEARRQLIDCFVKVDKSIRKATEQASAAKNGSEPNGSDPRQHNSSEQRDGYRRKDKRRPAQGSQSKNSDTGKDTGNNSGKDARPGARQHDRTPKPESKPSEPAPSRNKPDTGKPSSPARNYIEEAMAAGWPI